MECRAQRSRAGVQQRDGLADADSVAQARAQSRRAHGWRRLDKKDLESIDEPSRQLRLAVRQPCVRDFGEPDQLLAGCHPGLL